MERKTNLHFNWDRREYPKQSTSNDENVLVKTTRFFLELIRVHIRFAYDVKYQMSCLSPYIYERNVSVAARKIDRTKCSSIYDEAMVELSKELNLT